MLEWKHIVFCMFEKGKWGRYSLSSLSCIRLLLAGKDPMILFDTIISLYKRTVHSKTLDPNGNFQRPVFSLGVSQHMHKITNLWTFELNLSSKWQDMNETKKHPFHPKLCAFRCLISWPQVLNLRSQDQISGKLLLSRKLLHFRGSRFSQRFILSTPHHYSFPRKVLC